MSCEDVKVLEFNQYQKSGKTPFIIYIGLESLILKIDRCKDYREKSSTAKGREYILSGFSMSTISTLKYTENNHGVCRGKHCMKKFFESLRAHAIKIIDFKKKKNEIINKQQESNDNAKICYICKVAFEEKYIKDKKYYKVRDHCHYTGEYGGAAHSICNLKYSIPKETAILFHNRSNYNYHFIMKESAKEFEGQIIIYY